MILPLFVIFLSYPPTAVCMEGLQPDKSCDNTLLIAGKPPRGHLPPQSRIPWMGDEGDRAAVPGRGLHPG